MKKVMLTLMMVMGIMITAQAQKPNKGEKREQKREEIKAMKIGFITEKLKLTSDEATKFWPVYNEFHAKMEKLHEERKVNHKKLKKGVDSLTNADAEKIIDQELVFEERELALKKEYHTKFKSVLPVKKVALLYQAEHEFRREILKKAREQHHNQQGGKPQGAPAGKPGMDDEE
jgi:hypothetical protein